MKTKACIIITYFGKLPKTIDFFIQSCRNNPDFDWLVFTDCMYNDLPDNVKFISYTFNAIKELAMSKLKMSISMEIPYKMCDFRPAYGVIFGDYIKEYDFWGYGDFDVVYGCLNHFITDEIFEMYDKVYTCGHLSFIRNCHKCNSAYKLQTKNSHDYYNVFSNNNSFIFDEYKGINEKFINLGCKIYDQYEFVDIDLTYRRFRRVDKKTIDYVFPHYPFKKKLPSNYDYQIFIWENGHTYHMFCDKNGNISKVEVSYIHYRKKISSEKQIHANGFFVICNDGIVRYDGIINKELIERYNYFPGKQIEWKEYIQALKHSIITELGKRKWLVKLVRTIKGKRVDE